MNFTKGSNTRDLLSSSNMPHEIKSTRIQSARGLLRARLSYQFLSKSLPLLRGADTAQKQERRRFAENRGAATLGGPKLRSAATPHPKLLARPQKPLILLARKGTQTGSSMASDSRPETDPLTTALRPGRRRGSSRRKPPRKIARKRPLCAEGKWSPPGGDLPQKCDGARKSGPLRSGSVTAMLAR